MLCDVYNLPPYQFCDGGDTEETPEEDGATVTVELPKSIKVGYTDPTGNKVTKMLDVTGLSQEQITALLSKGTNYEQRLGDINRRVDIEAEKKAAQKIASQRGLSVDDVEKKIREVLAEGAEKEPTVDMDAVKDGDYSSLVAALDHERNQRKKLESYITDKEEREAELNELYRTINTAIEDTVEAFPNLKTKSDAFVAQVKKLKLKDAEAIRELGELMSSLSREGVSLDKLSKEDKEKLEKQIKDELETPPPPPEGGSGAPKSDKDDVPLDADGMMARAQEVIAGFKKGKH